jgi:hypothetical protein
MAEKKRWDEELCRDAVLAHARTLGHEASAEPGPPNKAPDYVLTLDGTDYALEVTMTMDSPRMGDAEKPRAQLWAQMNCLKLTIEERAAVEGVQVGELAVGFDERMIPTLNRRAVAAIAERVVAFLRATRGVPEKQTAALPVDESGETLARIIHTPNAPTKIGFFTSEAMPTARPIAALHEKVKERIDEKRERLAKHSRPKVLALGNLYVTAGGRRDYSDAFVGIDADDFTAVVVVHSRTKVWPLAWRVPPPVSRTL